MKKTIMCLTVLLMTQVVLAESMNISTYGAGSPIVNGNGNSVVVINGKVVSGGGNGVVGKGPLKAESRQVGTYSGVRLEGSANLVYTMSSKPSLVINAQENIFPLITTKVDQGQLIISSKDSFSTDQPIQVVASGPFLESLKISGSGNINVSGFSGKAMRVKVSGSGNVTVSGSVEKLEVQASGSGAVNASALKTADVRADISGSGDVYVFASRSVAVDISSSGKLIVEGGPKQRQVEKSGSGSVLFK